MAFDNGACRHARVEPRAGFGGTSHFIGDHWHFARGPTTVDPNDVIGDGQSFTSPILFVDGHAGSFDFTDALKASPSFPMEPTRDWYWYEPVK